MTCCLQSAQEMNGRYIRSYFKSSTPQHMVLIIGQGLRGGDNDRISCMRAKWIKVLHVAANNRVLDRRKNTTR